MKRTYIVNVQVVNFDTKAVVITPDPVAIERGDSIKWFSDDGKHEGNIDDPNADAFEGQQPWRGAKGGASNHLTAKRPGRSKYRVKVTRDDGVSAEADPEVIVT